MTRILRSDRTEFLVDALGAFLATPANPLARDVVLVHSNGLGTWLEQQLAHRLGVCAAVDFLQPAQLVERLYGAGEGWSRQALVWRLLDVLVQHVHTLPEVEEWSLADGAEHQARRLAQLALDLAPRFERYALYRPDQTATWTQGGDWQEHVWHLLAQQVPPPFQGAPPRVHLPGRLAVFCPGILPPKVMETLAAAGEQVPLLLCVLRPAVLRGHALHRSLGGQAAAFDRLLQRHFGDITPEDHFETPTGDEVLPTLQRAIAGQPPGAVSLTAHPTLRLHRCGGEQRQAEVLRDVLLEAFEDPTLEPRDVLVMTPNIDRFGPIIRAAMRLNRGPNAPDIPMRLADTSLRVRNTAARALLDAAQLLQGRYAVTDVLDLLGRPEVAEHWGVEPDTMERLTRLSGDAAIHWGVDVEHKRGLGLPETENFTWRHGLDRLLAGLATSESGLMLGLAPVGGPKAQPEHVGILAAFVQGLVEARDALTGAHLPAVWQARVLALLTHLCGTGGWTVRSVRRALDEVVAAGAGSTTPLPLAAFLRLLEDRFDLSEPGQQYLAGGVTVCAMVPMRSIPFRVVCLVGMDEDAYPRQGTQPAYDIMAAAPRDGDVSPRQDDRALLMETLLSARDRLEIFTTARSPRDGQERPPAVPVSELLDVLEELQPGLASAVTVDHPLQPYAAAPFLQGGRCFDPEHCEAARAAVVGRTAAAAPHRFLDTPLPAPENFTELRLHRFVSGLKNPIQFFCTQALGLYLPRDEEPLSDVEPLDDSDWTGHLGQWKLKKAVTEVLVEGGDPYTVLSARGRIPVGTRGVQLVASVAEPCGDLAQRVRAFSAATPHRVDIEIDGIRLHGAVGLRDGAVMDWTPSSGGPKHLLGPWVRAVALRACDGPVDRAAVVVKRGTNTAQMPSVTEAQRLLEGWLLILRDAMRAPLPFVAGFADAFKREEWNPDPYTAWVLGGQRMDGPVVGIPALPGRSFAELEAAILGSLP